MKASAKPTALTASDARSLRRVAEAGIVGCETFGLYSVRQLAARGLLRLDFDAHASDAAGRKYITATGVAALAAYDSSARHAGFTPGQRSVIERLARGPRAAYDLRVAGRLPTGTLHSLIRIGVAERVPGQGFPSRNVCRWQLTAKGYALAGVAPPVETSPLPLAPALAPGHVSAVDAALARVESQRVDLGDTRAGLLDDAQLVAAGLRVERRRIAGLLARIEAATAALTDAVVP